MKFILKILTFFTITFLSAQNFDYTLQLQPVTVSGLPGLHSYAFGQHNGKWLIIGGRTDGLHARQPFNSFPQNKNNSNLYVVDVATQQVWSASVNSLPTSIAEQLQTTNMNFYQDGSNLLIIGGYAFSATANDHITHDKLTIIDVPNTINAIINQTSFTTFFKQISDPIFANTGGQLGKIGSVFYLVGGQKFDGRYNPMGNPTFTQIYATTIKKFNIDLSGTLPTITNLETITDAINLRRRDYNLVPQVYPNGDLGYMISSGVFQVSVDLPFLYPVDITASGYVPQTSFNQYLSNYHSAKVGLYDAQNNQMHSIFFGGMSRYYYQNNTLMQDDAVPFVKTISRVTRAANGALTEYQLPIEMPALKGAGAEFILNKNIPHYENEVIKLNNLTTDETIIGHIFGGILSPSLNPFTVNQTTTTSADASIYAVKLIKNPSLHTQVITQGNPFKFNVFPNPSDSNKIQLSFEMPYITTINYIETSLDGKILAEGEIKNSKIGKNDMNFTLKNTSNSVSMLTLIFDGKYFVSEKIIIGTSKN